VDCTITIHTANIIRHCLIVRLDVVKIYLFWVGHDDLALRPVYSRHGLFVAVVVEKLKLFDRELQSKIRPSEAGFQADVAYLGVQVGLQQRILNDFAICTVHSKFHRVHTQLEFITREKLTLSAVAAAHGFLQLVIQHVSIIIA